MESSIDKTDTFLYKFAPLGVIGFGHIIFSFIGENVSIRDI